MPVDVVALARDLISCESVTPAAGGALDVLQRQLSDHGFATERVRFAEPGYDDVDNLYARWGSGSPCLLFAGHVDVVPPGPEELWRHPPFAAAVEDGVLFGRGAQDMKGGVAAFAAASLDVLARRKPAGSIAFLITGDEEGPAVNGTVKLLQWAHDRGERFDHCIVGEPTGVARLGDTVKIGRRGSLNGRLVCVGRQGHVAYPERAINPIPHLVRAMTALAEPLDHGTLTFKASNLEFTSIDVGNKATNVIPAEAHAAFNVRFNDQWTPDTLAAALRARVSAVTTLEGAATRLDVLPCNAPAFLTESSSFTQLVEAAIEAETGRKPELSTSGGTSDARFIQRYCPVLELGLVGDTMHMVDERVPLADLALLCRLYTRIIEGYFG